MAVYYCKRCDNYIDNDWIGCEEDPDDKTEVICPDCYETVMHKKEMARQYEIDQRNTYWSMVRDGEI